MARSYKHTNITGFTKAASDKEFKSAEHRRERAHVRNSLSDLDEQSIPDTKKFGNTYGSQKDGKMYTGKDASDFFRTTKECVSKHRRIPGGKIRK